MTHTSDPLQDPLRWHDLELQVKNAHRERIACKMGNLLQKMGVKGKYTMTRTKTLPSLHAAAVLNVAMPKEEKAMPDLMSRCGAKVNKKYAGVREHEERPPQSHDQEPQKKAMAERKMLLQLAGTISDPSYNHDVFLPFLEETMGPPYPGLSLSLWGAGLQSRRSSGMASWGRSSPIPVVR